MASQPARSPDSLRDLQVASIKRLLAFNSTESDDTPIWKVLVFDKLGRDVISSVLRVNDLRDAGVTVHMQLAADRQSIADVPAIYFVEPTQKSIEIIAQDLQRGLYDGAYLNFSSTLPRMLLEDLAAQTAQAGTAQYIQQVYDQYLNFIVTEPDLFSLGQPDVFRMLNASGVAESAIEDALDRIVSGLFSVVVTLDNIPVIRCPGGNAAEMIARRLDTKLRDYVTNTRQNYTTKTAHHYQRPVLIILDRMVDLVSMLSHSWTYQALVHDLCALDLNRITLPPGEDGKRKAYDVDPTDFFWRENANTVFPAVAEHLQGELDRYTKEKAELTRKTGITEIEDLDPTSAATTVHLQAALKALPEMQARKSTLDMHMTIATALLKGVQDRHIDKFVESEETIARSSKQQLLAVINDDTRKPQDKLRLFIIYFLSTEGDVKKADLVEFEAALEKAGCDLTPLKAIKKVRDLAKMSIAAVPVQQSQPAGGADQLLKGFSSLSSRFGERLQQAGISDNLNNLLAGVKNFLPSSSNLTITRIVESLMDPASQQGYTSSATLTDDYLYFDPRQRVSQQPAKPQTFAESIVFMVGGGNYVEYGNLLDWQERSKQQGRDRRVIYGASTIVSPEEFLNELARTQ
ncbi:Vesicle trafficking between the ER and Golgi [Savitreella phatthalungensis]